MITGLHQNKAYLFLNLTISILRQKMQFCSSCQKPFKYFPLWICVFCVFKWWLCTFVLFWTALLVKWQRKNLQPSTTKSKVISLVSLIFCCSCMNIFYFIMSYGTLYFLQAGQPCSMFLMKIVKSALCMVCCSQSNNSWGFFVAVLFNTRYIKFNLVQQCLRASYPLLMRSMHVISSCFLIVMTCGPWIKLACFVVIFRGVQGLHDAQTIFIEAYRMDRGENAMGTLPKKEIILLINKTKY